MLRVDQEKVPIPQGRKRGELTNQIASLRPGESLLIAGKMLAPSTRARCFVTAKRLGFTITTRATSLGLRVWRVGAPVDEIPMSDADVVPDAEVAEIEKQSKLAALRTLMTEPKVGREVEAGWQMVDRPEYDRVTGEDIYYEQHPKLGKREVRREPRLEGA